jgi:hypothetical protein
MDERKIPRYSKRMLENGVVRKALTPSTNYEKKVDRKQREWMRRKGID